MHLHDGSVLRKTNVREKKKTVLNRKQKKIRIAEKQPNKMRMVEQTLERIDCGSKERALHISRSDNKMSRKRFFKFPNNVQYIACELLNQCLGIRNKPNKNGESYLRA